MTLAQRNRHPADEMADVRAEIRTLRVREAELRAVLLDSECGLEGEDHVARIATLHQERLDIDALKAHFGAAALKPFMVDREVCQVWIGAKSRAARTVRSV